MAPIVALLVGCGSGGDGGGGGSPGPAAVGSYTLSRGVAQKGPLQIGSTVTVAELDDNLNPNGKIYITEVTDNLGNFRLGSTIGTRLAMILAQGFFMDENTGDFTSAAITLRGISDLSVESSPSVNVLTTLQYIRLNNLVSSGKSFQDAYNQSQTEVLNAFGVDASKINNMGSLYQMKINGSSDADGVLLAISATLGKAAAMRSGSSTAAQLSDIINTIASDLSQAGQITTKSVKAELMAAQVALDIPRVRSNVQSFYATRGITVTAPVFEDWISKDGTGTLPNRTQIAPTAFSFSDTNNARPGQSYTSEEITVSGVDAGASVTVSVTAGSMIVKNSTPLSGLNTTATNGDKLAIKTTSAAYGSSVTSALTVGASTSSWKLNSQSPGTVNPNEFSLAAINNAIPNQSYTSSSVTVNGLNDGEVAYVISTNGATINLNGVSTGLKSTIGQNGDVITLSASGPAYGASVTFTLTVGAKTADWILTAQTPRLVTPTPFSFTSTTDEINQLITSNTIVIGGLNSGEVAQANLSVSGAMPNGASMLVNGVLVNQLPTIVSQGDQIAIRTTLAESFGATGTVTVTVGTRSENWTVGTRMPAAKYYKRRGAANSYLDNWYSDGTVHTYYAIPFVPSSEFSLRYFSLGFSNGSTDSVYLYANNSNSDSPDTLLATASLGSIFKESTNYTYPYNGYTSTGSGITYTDSSGSIYWLSGMVQGKFGSGINLVANKKYWIVVKWSNNFPHDSRVEASTGGVFDFSQLKGSSDGMSWSTVTTGVLGAGVVPAMFMTD